MAIPRHAEASLTYMHSCALKAKPAFVSGAKENPESEALNSADDSTPGHGTSKSILYKEGLANCGYHGSAYNESTTLH